MKFEVDVNEIKYVYTHIAYKQNDDDEDENI